MLDILVLLTTTFRSMGHTSQRFFNCVTWCVLMYFPTKVVGVGPYPIAKNTTAVFEHIYHDYTYMYHDGFRHRKKSHYSSCITKYRINIPRLQDLAVRGGLKIEIGGIS